MELCWFGELRSSAMQSLHIDTLSSYPNAQHLLNNLPLIVEIE